MGNRWTETGSYSGVNLAHSSEDNSRKPTRHLVMQSRSLESPTIWKAIRYLDTWFSRQSSIAPGLAKRRTTDLRKGVVISIVALVEISFTVLAHPLSVSAIGGTARFVTTYLRHPTDWPITTVIESIAALALSWREQSRHVVDHRLTQTSKVITDCSPAEQDVQLHQIAY